MIKKILIALLVIFIIMQFFGPEKNLGSISSIDAFIEDTNPSEEVLGILKNTCFDCHSDVTRYPWYSKITPVNYWLADHIEHGKGHFNVSGWDTLDLKKRDHKMDELVEEVTERKMPLPSYTYAHKDANLTDAQIKAIKDWADRVRFKYMFSMPQPE